MAIAMGDPAYRAHTTDDLVGRALAVGATAAAVLRPGRCEW